MYVVIKRFKEVFRGTEKECQRYAVTNYVNDESIICDVLSVVTNKRIKIEIVEYEKDRSLSYRLLYYDFFWKNNETNTPNRKDYPDWVLNNYMC